MAQSQPGKLVIIGGAEEKSPAGEILTQAADLVTGKLVIITTATQQPTEVGWEYYDLFTELGVAEVEVLHINSWREANEEEFVTSIREAQGIFFTGGNQLRITSLLGGSQVCHEIRAGYRAGKTIIGTSAGAAIMSRLMIVRGRNDDNPQPKALRLALGLGLIDDVIVDQHFSQRGRLGRLLTGLAQNPALLGLGIDENTAVIVEDEICEVIGSGTVTVADCSQIAETNIANLAPDEALTLTNVKLHILSTGYSFDLRTKEIISPE